MAGAKAPIRLQEAFSLTSLGVQPGALSFQTATMESDRFVAVCEKSVETGQPSLLLVDTHNPTKPVRRPIQADSVVVNPDTKVMAMQSGSQLQLFDLTAKAKIKSFVSTESVALVRWANEKTLAIVTSAAVYHWKCDDDEEPVKVFDRHPNLTNSQIVSYKVAKGDEWCTLVGFTHSQDGSVNGNIQLYSVKKGMTQPIEGHAATFISTNYEGYETTLFAFATKTAKGSKLFIIEVGHENKPQGAPKFETKESDIFYPPEMPMDHPVSMLVSSKYSIIYMVTRMGYVHLYNTDTGLCVYQNRVSDTTPFLSIQHRASGGLLLVNRRGQVLLLSILPEAVVPYVMHTLKNLDLATTLASKNAFPGMENIFVDQFEELFEEERYREAAIVAAEAPGGALRSPQTIAKFKAASQGGVSPSPLMTFFTTILERGRLNKAESLELAFLMAQSGKVQSMEKWLKEDKMECSEELGDFFRPQSLTIALAVYIQAESHMKAIACMIDSGQTARISSYAKKVGLDINHIDLVNQVSQYNPKAALVLANQAQAANALVIASDRRQQELKGVEQMINMFLSKGLLNEAANYALDNLLDTAEDGKLQTKILVSLFMNLPQVAEQILVQDIWHFYDTQKVGQMCERVGLFQLALENYTDLADVKRVITNTHLLNEEFVVRYFGELRSEDALEVIEELIKSNPRGNMKLCVRIAALYTGEMDAKKLIEVFKKVKIEDAVFYYLQAIVDNSDDPFVHYEYIDAGVKLQQFSEVERVTRLSNYYDPQKVKKLLMESKLKDPRPLVNVCDRFGYVDEMVTYMMKNSMGKFVEAFVQRVNPMRTPIVVGTLLDVGTVQEAYLIKLILSVKNVVPVGELVDQVEKRGKLKMLHKFLESKIADGSNDVEVHSGVAKVYVESNINAEHFLVSNPYYDSRVVGKFCEKRNPYLAYVAYRRGLCDDELFAVTNKNSMFKEQAIYVVNRQNDDLWERVLNENNAFRKLIVDQIISTALPEVTEPEKVASAVKAFMTADLPEVLMQLLEKLVVDTSSTAFKRNKNLQNLLILTAIKTEKDRVMEYVNRLDNFDAGEVAKIAIDAELYEEGYAIFQKFNREDEAMEVLIKHIKDWDRASEYAAKVDRPEVWTILGTSMLESGVIEEGVKCLMRAKDPTQYALVITAALEHAKDEEYSIVVKYLLAARRKVDDLKMVDTEIVYGYCRCRKYMELEEFLSRKNEANIEDVAERCYDEEIWIGAKILFLILKNWSRLAEVYVKLGEYNEAVECAKKANRQPIWKIVCFGCVRAKEFRLAKICGLPLVVDPNELMEVVSFYESRGYFEEVIDLLDSALVHEKAHTGLFTELGVLYTKYKEEVVEDYVKMWWKKAHLPRLVSACEEAYLWLEATYLYFQYEEFDNAARVMMDHAPDAFNPDMFSDTVSRVGSMETMYKAIQFYIDEHPTLLLDLMFLLANRCDATRAITILRKGGNLTELGMLPMVKGYLLKMQAANVREINEAVNSVLLAEEDIPGLDASVDSYDNFDLTGMAKTLESHRLVEARRIATKAYRKLGKWERALEISTKDKIYIDCIEAVKVSKDVELAEQLAEQFLKERRRECFTALLYGCYEFFKPETALELSWRHQAKDFAMPYMVQNMAEVGAKLVRLEEESASRKELEERDRKEREAEINEDASVLMYGLQSQQTGGVPMLGAPPATQTPQIAWQQQTVRGPVTMQA
ncbi:hypothetical protein NDN08_000787 [Rhodosorus marinus]|uniref:Clathrin heavy chain n=1 Tax=Rhodosorus marinus TaxID=101924 RepID=A0AAV8UP43_9RHOD|nr:hypothetical protein NDN08_000787 [Rhodosorus marinus]